MFVYPIVVLPKGFDFFFRAMLYGGMKESDEGEIVLEETNVFAFRILLRYAG